MSAGSTRAIERSSLADIVTKPRPNWFSTRSPTTHCVTRPIRQTPASWAPETNSICRPTSGRPSATGSARSGTRPASTSPSSGVSGPNSGRLSPARIGSPRRSAVPAVGSAEAAAATTAWLLFGNPNRIVVDRFDLIFANGIAVVGLTPVEGGLDAVGETRLRIDVQRLGFGVDVADDADLLVVGDHLFADLVVGDRRFLTRRLPSRL